MSKEKCCTGCNIFFGGEIRRIKECVFYPESLTEIYDRKDEENAKLKQEIARLREALELIERDAWETMKEDIEKIARKALKRGE